MKGAAGLCFCSPSFQASGEGELLLVLTLLQSHKYLPADPTPPPLLPFPRPSPHLLVLGPPLVEEDSTGGWGWGWHNGKGWRNFCPACCCNTNRYLDVSISVLLETDIIAGEAGWEQWTACDLIKPMFLTLVCPGILGENWGVGRVLKFRLVQLLFLYKLLPALWPPTAVFLSAKLTSNLETWLIDQSNPTRPN